MNGRINDKIGEIKKYLGELNSFKPSSLKEYLDKTTKAACERYFEKIIEAVVDLGFMVVKSKSLEIPEDDADLFDVLERNNIIDSNLCKMMKEAKGMKNIISHQYGEINDELVFQSIAKELEKDVRNFIGKVKK